MPEITFVGHFVRQNMRNTYRNPIKLLNLQYQSFCKTYPKNRFIVLSDQKTPLDGLNPKIEVVRTDFDTSNILLHRWKARCDFLKHEKEWNHTALIDFDIVVQEEFHEVLEGDFAVAVTQRKYAGKRKYPMNINGGVILLSANHRLKAMGFVKRVTEVYEQDFMDEPWWGEQYTLSKITPGMADVKYLPQDEYNYTPGRKYRMSKKLHGKKILHFKNHYGRMMEDYVKLFISEDVGLFRKKIISIRYAGYGKKLIKSIKKFLSKTIGHKSWIKQVRRKIEFHSNMKRIISGNKILILGSGPTAAELKEIPEDVRVLTCNAGIKLFVDRNIERVVDVLFIIRNKDTKKITVYENGEPRSVAKSKYIEQLIKKSQIDCLITNKTKYLSQLAVDASLNRHFRHLLFENGICNRYIRKTLKGTDPARLAGNNDRPWTSTGMRLLQFALYFKAKEIYLAGMDLGEGGYFWAENNNPWTHTDIDRNFLTEVSKRFPNVFSISNSTITSPILPEKSL